MPINIQPTVDVLTLESGHVYAVEGEISTEYNHPINGSYLHLTYEIAGSVSGSNGYKVIKCTDAYSGRKWIRTQKWDAWNDWIKDATATPPQEYDLPLADGWTKAYCCKYFKTQDNLCIVDCGINGHVVIGSVCVATLPVGFRPKEICVFPGHFYKSGERRTADVLVLTNGEIHVYADVDGIYVSFLCAFLADG